MKFQLALPFGLLLLILSGCTPSQKDIEALPLNKVIEDDHLREAQFELAYKKLGLFAVYYSSHLENGTELYRTDSLADDMTYREYLSRLKPNEIDSLKKIKERMMNTVRENYETKLAEQARLPKSN